MIMVNIHQIKAKLSEFVEAALNGERVVICKRNRPIVELHAIVQPRTGPRPIGGGPYVFDVPDDAFAPLADDDIADWDRGLLYPSAPESPRSRIAERPNQPHGTAKKRKR